MNESVGYTVTINIIITFIIIVFVFLSNILIYYKSNKVGNIIVDSIEKNSGFNSSTKEEINKKLSNIGYNRVNITCNSTVKEKDGKTCSVVDEADTQPNGYCVYQCVSTEKKDEYGNPVMEYYYYKIKANMIINIPIINDIVNGSVFSSTENMYNFEGVNTPAPLNPS